MVEQLYDVIVIERIHDADLVDYLLLHACLNDERLRDLLERIVAVGGLALDLVDFSESTYLDDKPTFAEILDRHDV